MFAASRFVRRALTLSLAIALSAAVVAGAQAQTVNVSLNVRYNSPGVPTSGGTWQLVARSSNFGLAGLDVYLTGVTAPTQSSMPQGTVNGSDWAGFREFQTYSPSEGVVGITVQQIPVPVLGPNEEEGIFYGVGTLANGHPGDIGPDIESLTGGLNIPWAVGNLALGNPAWSAAVLVAEGSLIQNVAPAFAQIAGYRGSGLIFTTLGTDTSEGNSATYNLLAANTIIREITGFPGDFNNDHKVNALDYSVWRNNLGDPTEADIHNNGDGLMGVNESDFTVWKLNYGNTLPGAGTGGLAGGQPAPEPASALLLAGAAGVLFLRRKERVLRHVRVS